MSAPILSGRFVGATAVASTAYLGVGLLAPLVPTLKTEYGLSNLEVGVTLAAFAAGRAVASTPAGFLIDRFGARVTALGGCGLGGLAALGAVGANGYLWLVAVVAVQGVGAALATTAAMTAVLADSPPERVGSYLSWHFGVVLAAISLAPVFSGLSISLVDSRGPFVVYAVGLAVAALVAFLGDWDDDRLQPATNLPLPFTTSEDRSVVLLAMIATFILFATIAGVLNTLLPVLAAEFLELDEVTIGYLLATIALGNLAIVHRAGMTTDRSGRRPVIVWGLVSMGLGSTILSVVEQVWLLFAVAALLGVARGYVNVGPLAVIADVVPGGHRGRIVGLNRSVAAGGLALGPLLVGKAADTFGVRWAFVVVGAIVALSGLVMQVMPETLGRREKLER